MVGYIGTKAVNLSTTGADINGDAIVDGSLTVGGAFTSLGIDDNATSTAITIDASENVGIGGTPAAWSASVRVLEFDGQAADYLAFNSGVSGYLYQNVYFNGTNNLRKNEGFASAYGNVLGEHLFFTGPTGAAGTAVTLSERMRIGTSGSVGIGTASVDSLFKVELKPAATVLAGFRVGLNGTSANYLDGDTNIFRNGAGTQERMRIDASGSVSIAHSVTNPIVSGVSGFKYFSTGTLMACQVNGHPAEFGRQGTDGSILDWYKSGTKVGSVSVTVSATAYNTSSDYRLKENVTPIQGAGDIVKAMRPATYTFKADGSWADGFIAHELQELHPVAVTGSKDAMKDEEYEVTPAVEATFDAEGVELTPAEDAVMGTRSVPDYQGVDYSKLTPILTAALQEALNKIDELTARIETLEAK